MSEQVTIVTRDRTLTVESKDREDSRFLARLLAAAPDVYRVEIYTVWEDVEHRHEIIMGGGWNNERTAR